MREFFDLIKKDYTLLTLYCWALKYIVNYALPRIVVIWVGILLIKWLLKGG